jgi:putative ABC transport system permease protein
MASTLDRSLEDTIGYTIGADAVLVTASDAQTTDSSDSSSSATTTVTGFNTLPVADLLTVEGVDQAARVGRYPAQIKLSTQYASGTLLAVDRAAMAAVTKFRSDYASLPAADLFNLLATNRAGILINSQAAAQYKLKVGQTIDYQVQALNQWYPIKAPILGLVDYFPTLDPRTKFFIIANIDPVFEAIGTELPSDYWMSLKPGADQAKVEAAVAEKGYPVIQWLNPQDALQEALSGAARRGVLGFLSVGFIASIVLTLVSSIIQNAASFKAQAVHLGSLQAMGLSNFAVSLYLFVSQGLAVSSGILGGTVIGAATTLLFLPLLDFSGGLPPYLVRVAWGDIITVYALFAGVLFAVTLFTTFLLGRQHLFTVVKLGDSA